MAAGLTERWAVRNWRTVAGLFFCTTFLESLAFGHLNAFTPLFLERELGMAYADVPPWAGLLAATTFGVAFPLAPFWGSLAERYSRKLVIVRSQYLEVFVFSLAAFAPDLGWFFLARMLLGLTFGNLAIVIASQSLLTPDRRMASAIATVQAANPIALSLGPPVGALLLPLIGMRGLFMLDAAGCLLAALLVTFLMPEPPGRDTSKSVMANMRGSMGIVLRRPALRWNFASWFLTRGAQSVVDTYLPVRIADLARPDPAGAIGVVLGVFGLMTSVATWATGRLVDRMGATRVFWPAMAVSGALVVGVALAPWLWLLAVCAWLRSVPLALTGTVLYAHLAQSVRREERAPVMSLTPVPRNLAQFSVPLVAAGAATFGGTAALFVAAAVYGLAAWAGRQMQTSEHEKERGDVPDVSPLEDAKDLATH